MSRSTTGTTPSSRANTSGRAYAHDWVSPVEGRPSTSIHGAETGISLHASSLATFRPSRIPRACRLLFRVTGRGRMSRRRPSARGPQSQVPCDRERGQATLEDGLVLGTVVPRILGNRRRHSVIDSLGAGPTGATARVDRAVRDIDEEPRRVIRRVVVRNRGSDEHWSPRCKGRICGGRSRIARERDLSAPAECHIRGSGRGRRAICHHSTRHRDCRLRLLNQDHRRYNSKCHQDRKQAHETPALPKFHSLLPRFRWSVWRSEYINPAVGCECITRPCRSARHAQSRTGLSPVVDSIRPVAWRLSPRSFVASYPALNERGHHEDAEDRPLERSCQTRQG